MGCNVRGGLHTAIQAHPGQELDRLQQALESGLWVQSEQTKMPAWGLWKRYSEEAKQPGLQWPWAWPDRE